MRILPSLLVVTALLFVPLTANAAQTFTGTIPATTPISVPPVPAGSLPYSTPVVQGYQQININGAPGTIITATLAYTDTSGGQAGGNDLDLTLLLPSAAPIPIVLPPTQDFLVKLVTSRVTRATCADAAAESDNKPALGEGAAESISYTVPAGGETGTYALLVRGFLVTVDQPFSLSVGVDDGNGRDLSGSATRIIGSALITTNPHCELI